MSAVDTITWSWGPLQNPSSCTLPSQALVNQVESGIQGVMQGYLLGLTVKVWYDTSITSRPRFPTSQCPDVNAVDEQVGPLSTGQPQSYRCFTAYRALVTALSLLRRQW